MIVLFDLAMQSGSRPSPFCWRAKLALKHKNLAFEARATAFSQIRSLGDGSFKTLPIVDDDGRWTGGSRSIAEYLESHYEDAATLFPHDPQRLFANFVESWVDTTLHPQIFPLVACAIWECLPAPEKAYFRQTREIRLGTTLEDARDRSLLKISDLRASFGPMRRILKTQPFLAGENAAYADYIVFGALKWQRLVCRTPLLDASDAIQAWYARVDNFAPTED
ncbi:MAG: glutathione S-transferase family protein [Gammaproteobacteria bacterium]|nr:glutathione S-transferase family protein [Gammaproteobacteria bacterium]